METITALPKTKNKRALVRVDFNVPISGNKILDTRRIVAAFETITLLLKKGYQPLLLAHRGESEESLRPVATLLAKHFPVVFVTDSLLDRESILKRLDKISSSSVVLFENIRRYPEEEKNDTSFAKSLSKIADIYVNDAFSVSHRKHASVIGIPKYLPSYAGMQLQKEIAILETVTKKTKHPFVFILGGAKFETKIPLIRRFAKVADHVVITGALLNSFYKTAGFEVGQSVVEDGFEKEIRTLLRLPNLLLPVDVVVLRGGKAVACSLDEVEKGDTIVDIGPQSVILLTAKLTKAKQVVWNGPTGWYEKGFVRATKDIAKVLTEIKAHTIVGGGDTGAVVEKVVGNANNIFVSTGGGATIAYLAQGTLPGIAALK